jgi:hypothetical protein
MTLRGAIRVYRTILVKKYYNPEGVVSEEEIWNGGPGLYGEVLRADGSSIFFGKV